MKVLLVNPSRFYSAEWGGGRLSHLMVLYSHLRTRCPNVEVDVLDLELELGVPADDDEVDRFMLLARAALDSSGFDIIGISCWTSLHYSSTMAVARLAKVLSPECEVVVGGYHPSACPEDFRGLATPIDWLVIGEGELALEHIVRRTSRRSLLASERPRIVHGTPVETGQELLWSEYKYYRNADTVPLWLSRGCPFQCTFCLDRLSRWRALAPTAAVAELRRILASLPRVEAISIMDPIFGLSRAWRREFLDELLAADMPLRFWAETRADVWIEEDLARLAGLEFQLDIGLDSVSPRMIEIMQKARDPGKYLAAFERTDDAMQRHGIPHEIYLIVNYPGETEATLAETLGYCQSYRERKPDSVGRFSAQPFKFFPGNDVYARLDSYAAEFGTEVVHPRWWQMNEGPYRVLAARVVASRELARADAIFTPFRVVRMINSLWASPLGEPEDAGTDAAIGEDAAQLDGLEVRVRASVYAHQRDADAVQLVNFETGESLECEADEARWLGRGWPSDGDEPGALERRFWQRLVSLGFAEWFTRPPRESISGPVEAIVTTKLGTLTIALFNEDAPRSVACFVQASRLGLYRGCEVERSRPGAYVVIEGRSWDAPPFTLEPESGTRTTARGTLSMNVGRHPFRFTLARRSWPELDATATVVGVVTDGLEVLDALLEGDQIIDVGIRGFVSPSPNPDTRANTRHTADPL